jgi:hypothetical protein
MVNISIWDLEQGEDEEMLNGCTFAGNLKTLIADLDAF